MVGKRRVFGKMKRWHMGRNMEVYDAELYAIQRLSRPKESAERVKKEKRLKRPRRLRVRTQHFKVFNVMNPEQVR